MTAFEVTIYHNPACGTSRKALAAIREAGIEPCIVEYLKTPPTRAEIEGLLDRSGLWLRDILRKKAPAYAALGLDDPKLSDDEIFAAIAREPVLIERPIVCSSKGVALCRPAERVADLLP
ncbi:arsenate reductase [Rhodoblastus acidophilus]|uniref:Arsenate reductase n=1 Tax=Rhodoblastus acidophilus TaxID=1074 RepID=A0A212S439_RHOAC|nr:arsenate reductase (glutaredoxin) [Rhodoblastus acidophilus]PPQ37701.1 arsenate reductase (glutaredoxin) [Rhodoblastus acidophilus]RAI23913.1 arsenate reductase (glutaredoxin) [Rhodoblastus acidophilus]SNB79931.1 arsenate reductase [Rhodoblastus acidophilus]